MYKYIVNRFKPIKAVPIKRTVLDRVGSIFLKIGNTVEMLFVLLVWIFIFTNYQFIGGYTIKEITTYIIAGNFIAIITGYLLHRNVIHSLFQSRPDELEYKPFRFLKKIFKGFNRNFLPFILAIILNLTVVYFFINNILINFNIAALIVIAIIAVLAFITELLIAYLIHLYIIIRFETGEPYKIFVRIKKLLAGNFFPLNFLPLVFVKVSLVLPFAYTFYVPTEIYLKKMSIKEGVVGIGVQIFWVVILYLLIKYIGSKKKSRTKV